MFIRTFTPLVLLPASLIALATPAHAQSTQKLFNFYGDLYPEWAFLGFGTASSNGSEVGNMGTLRNDRVKLTSEPKQKPNTSGDKWSNSYIGVRGEARVGDFTVGYNFQGQVDFEGKFRDNFRTRDGYLFAAHPMLGRVQIGQMDSHYKQLGDRVRLFNITSGNYFGSSRMLSGVGWRGQGETTFHNRVDHSLTWVSPSWRGVDLGLSHSLDATDGAPGHDATLSAAGLRWQQGPWYAALATEIHRDWLPLSFGSADTVPAATSILNAPATTRSRDQAVRLSGAWSEAAWRVSADVARLRYTEDDGSNLVGKFRRYDNTTWAVAAEYQPVEKWTLGFNHARGSAGECVLSGGVGCSTAGFGAFQTTFGVLRRFTQETSVFVVGQHVRNGIGTRYASAPTGAPVDIFAIGIKYKFQ